MPSTRSMSMPQVFQLKRQPSLNKSGSFHVNAGLSKLRKNPPARSEQPPAGAPAQPVQDSPRPVSIVDIANQVSHHKIAHGLKITGTGQLHFKGLLRIDGVFEGELVGTGGLLVGRDGEVVGSVRGLDEVYIEGHVVGDISCKKIQIRHRGSVTGDISCISLGMDDTATLNGSAKVVGPAGFVEEGEWEGDADGREGEVVRTELPVIEEVKEEVAGETYYAAAPMWKPADANAGGSSGGGGGGGGGSVGGSGSGSGSGSGDISGVPDKAAKVLADSKATRFRTGGNRNGGGKGGGGGGGGGSGGVNTKAKEMDASRGGTTPAPPLPPGPGGKSASPPNNVPNLAHRFMINKRG